MSYLIYDNYDIYQSDSYNIAFCSVNEILLTFYDYLSYNKNQASV